MVVIPSSAPREVEQLLIPAEFYDIVFGPHDDGQHRNINEALSHTKNQGAFKFFLGSDMHVIDVAVSSS